MNVQITPLFGLVLTLVMMILSAGVAWGTVKTYVYMSDRFSTIRIKNLEEKADRQEVELKKLVSELYAKIEGLLYDSNKQPIYVPLGRCIGERENCMDHREGFSQMIFGKMKELELAHKELAAKVEANKDVVLPELRVQSETLKRIEDTLKEFIKHAPPQHSHDVNGRVIK